MAEIITPPISVSPGEAARLLGFSRKYIYDLIGKGQLRKFNVGRSARIPYADLTAFMERQLERQEMAHQLAAQRDDHAST